MLKFLKSLFGKGADPVAYRVALDWFAVQLPGDFLGTGLHWVWESSRAFKGTATLPESREPTVLTAELGAVFSAEMGEYYLEAHREVTVFATAAPVALSAAELQAAIKVFAKNGKGPLVAIVYQPPQGPTEVFLPREPGTAMGALMGVWAERLGKSVAQIERVDGGAMLKRIFLNKEALAAGAIRGFPAAG